MGLCQRCPWCGERQSGHRQLVVRESVCVGGEGRGEGDLLGEAVRCGEDPPICDEAAPTEVASISLDADLPWPLALQGILPTHHPVQHPRAPAD